MFGASYQARATLPFCIWHHVTLLVYGDDTLPKDVLAKRTTLGLISKDVREATRCVPVQLDLRGAINLAAVKALLAAAPVSRLWLRKDMRGDEILRDGRFRERSCSCLRELSASISCTDTLQVFRNLQLLHLQADVLPKLYPAVLWGVRGLQKLSLHHYQDFCLTQLPEALVPSIKLIEVTPKPVALRSKFALRLPPAMALHCLSLHGSFHQILSPKAAPEVMVDVGGMCAQCREVVVEAEDVIFLLAGAGAGGRDSGVQRFAEALLQSCGPSQGCTWQQLEFQVLGGMAILSSPPQHVPAGGVAGASLHQPLHTPEDFAAELQHALLGYGEGAVSVSVHRKRCSIFEPAVLRIGRVARGG